jgi:ATP-dependent Clp protease ATP-binding subunit ClpC
MFEKYTEKARRVIFFARYEASQFGSAAIEPAHLLLGLIREDQQTLKSFIHGSHVSTDQIRNIIQKTLGLREKIPESADLPISPNAKRVLVYAAEESKLLHHSYIGTEHLLIGLLRQEDTIAFEILKNMGFSVNSMREELKQRTDEMRAEIHALRKDQQADLPNLVRQMRTLARAMMEKCDQIEDRLDDSHPEG